MLLRCLVLLLCTAAVQAAPHTVILVRHAEKAAEPAGDPALSAAGSERAERLAAALQHARVESIVVTQFRRTRETAAPIATRQAIMPVIVDAGGDTAAHVAAVVAAVRAAEGSVLVVGHSNTVPAVIAALGGPSLPWLCETSFGQVFVLHDFADAPRLQRWRYGKDDPAPADGCL
jgi:phosphohistidine phosphatase SixA